MFKTIIGIFAISFCAGFFALQYNLASNYSLHKPNPYDKANERNEVLKVTAEQVARAYKRNEVAADQKYFGKYLLVTGVVKSINSGIGNKPYIVFRDESLLGPQASDFPDMDTNYIVDLKQGDEVTLTCKGGGSVIGTAMFKECAVAAQYQIF